MRRLVIATGLVLGMLLSGTGVTLADHDHDLITPGTTVVDIGNGQTERCATDPGGHQFHAHMHTGTPGMVAFANPSNPVSIVKTEVATC
jgi:hypothetical protein